MTKYRSVSEQFEAPSIIKDDTLIISNTTKSDDHVHYFTEVEVTTEDAFESVAPVITVATVSAISEGPTLTYDVINISTHSTDDLRAFAQFLETRADAIDAGLN